MKKIRIEALTQKGQEVMKIDDEKVPKHMKVSLKLIGLKQKVISEEPYIVEITFSKKMPNIINNVIDQMATSLTGRFKDEGAIDGKDFVVRIVEDT